MTGGEHEIGPRFLQLLTAQLEYQDPLDPLESTDFAVQLATFSGVEQAVLTNDLLVALGDTLAATSVADMANWIGTEIRAAMPAYYEGEPITLLPNPAATSDMVELVVTNEEGEEVDRYEIAISAEPIEWYGLGEDGQPLPDAGSQLPRADAR